MPREIVRKPRLIYPQIATSLSIAELSVLAELLFWRILPQADDQGRLPGEPRQVKAIVCPMRDELTIEKIPDLLAELEKSELIVRYSNSSTKYIQIAKWWDYQAGMRRIFPSQYPPPEGWQDRTRGVETIEETGPRIAEHGIRDLLLDALKRGEVKLGNATLVEVDSEVRVGNSYIDLLAKDSVGRFYLIEVKRTRLTNSHFEQITHYRDLLEAKTKARPSQLLVGYGMVEAFNTNLAKTHSINVVTYDDHLTFRQVVLGDVKVSGDLTRYLSSDVVHPKPEPEPESKTRIIEPEIEPEEEGKSATTATETAGKANTSKNHEGSKGATETVEESELFAFLETLEGWRFGRAEDLAWLQEFRQDWPDFNLSLAKACRDYYSGKPPPKNKGPWKNRFREWMIHERKFEKERGEHEQAKDKRGKVHSREDFSGRSW